jgi:hypothetical protein
MYDVDVGLIGKVSYCMLISGRSIQIKDISLQLNPLSTVIYEKLIIVTQLFKKVAAFYGT